MVSDYFSSEKVLSFVDDKFMEGFFFACKTVAS